MTEVVHHAPAPTGSKQLTMIDLAEKSAAELEGIFWRGLTPRFEDLAGWEFRGFNHPQFIEYLGFRKFIKGFFTGDAGEGMIEGFNLEVLQNTLYGKWLGKPSDINPKRHGYYHVYPVRGDERDNLYPHALLLNYGASKRNPRIDITKVLRDYLVQVEADNTDLYLGKAYLALGPLRPAVSFFILERHREHDFTGQ